MVVIASFLVNLIADGITFSFGVIFAELEAEYADRNTASVSVVFSLFHSVPLLSGPIASALADRFGCRKVTIAGSLLAAVGFLLSSFCHSLELLFVTFGLIAGFGLSLCYVAAILIVAYYFEKYRSFATGISVCGSGVGTVIFAPFIKYLVNEFGGWRPACIILAGILLNMCVCGALFRDLPWTRRKKRKIKRRLRKSVTKRFSIGSLSSQSPQQQQQQQQPQMPGIAEVREILETGGDLNIASLFSKEELADCPRLSSSLVNIPTYISSGEKLPEDVVAALTRNKDAFDLVMQNYPDTLLFGSCGNNRDDHDDVFTDNKVKEDDEDGTNDGDEGGEKNEGNVGEEATGAKLKRKVSSLFKKKPQRSILKKPSTNCNPNHHHHQEQQQQQHQQPARNEVAVEIPQSEVSKQQQQQQQQQNRSNLLHLRMRRQSLTYRGAMLNINRYRLRASSCPDIYRNSMAAIPQLIEENRDGFIPGDLAVSCNALLSAFCCCCSSNILNFKFFVFCLSNFILYAWYDVMYAYLLLYTEQDLAFPSVDATYLISIIGILNTVGEVIIGYVGDRTWMNLSVLYALCMLACGLSTAFVPLLTNYSLLALMAGVFGFAISANYSLTSPILVELVSLEDFSNAYGLLLFVQGVSNLMGPPFAGLLHDLTGEWILTFALAGIFIGISGLLLFLIPCCNSKSREKDEKDLEIGGKTADTESGRQLSTSSPPIDIPDIGNNNNRRLILTDRV